MSQDLEARLKGTRQGQVVLEFLTNSGHFPIANLFLELLREGPRLLLQFDLYTIMGAAVLQSWLLGTWEHRGAPRPLLGNLVGPLAYTAVEGIIEGRVFFSTGNHVAYLLFGLAIGLLQEVRTRTGGRWADTLVIVENVVRTNILLVMYWVFEAADEPRFSTLPGFLSDGSHVYIVLGLTFLGFMLGLANMHAQAYLAILRDTAHQLRRYSEWFLGKDILHSAVADPGALAIQRRDRAVLFMDIRGFTAWSERQRPEEVVSMLNAFFERSEAVWERHGAIKTKFTGDEIMLVFASARDAALAGLALLDAIGPHLSLFGLAAGIGIHAGVLVEGLIGSREVKGYDVIGDTVNTAKRICDRAAGGEVLISQSCLEGLGEGPAVGDSRLIEVKGKVEPLLVHSLVDIPGRRGPATYKWGQCLGTSVETP